MFLSTTAQIYRTYSWVSCLSKQIRLIIFRYFWSLVWANAICINKSRYLIYWGSTWSLRVSIRVYRKCLLVARPGSAHRSPCSSCSELVFLVSSLRFCFKRVYFCCFLMSILYWSLLLSDASLQFIINNVRQIVKRVMMTVMQLQGSGDAI